ncbi:MAG: MarR family transcriptional regulator [Gammaproteobacteria bacterium]
MAVQDFSRSLPMRLYRALAVVMPRFRRIFAKAGLTEQQWRVLRVLWEQPSVPQSALVELTLIPAPSLIGVLDRLATAGLVERRRGTGDRRVVEVAATAAGRALEERLMPDVQATYAALRASLDESTWRALENGLDELIHAQQPREGVASGRPGAKHPSGENIA